MWLRRPCLAVFAAFDHDPHIANKKNCCKKKVLLKKKLIVRKKKSVRRECPRGWFAACCWSAREACESNAEREWRLLASGRDQDAPCAARALCGKAERQLVSCCSACAKCYSTSCDAERSKGSWCRAVVSDGFIIYLETVKKFEITAKKIEKNPWCGVGGVFVKQSKKFLEKKTQKSWSVCWRGGKMGFSETRAQYLQYRQCSKGPSVLPAAYRCSFTCLFTSFWLPSLALDYTAKITTK